jgi:hypothetical protein
LHAFLRDRLLGRGRLDRKIRYVLMLILAVMM